MTDGCTNFRKFLVEGTKPNLKKIKEYVDRSLMLVTALAPVIGYDKASKIAHYAMDNDLTLKEAALKLGFVTRGGVRPRSSIRRRWSGPTSRRSETPGFCCRHTAEWERAELQWRDLRRFVMLKPAKHAATGSPSRLASCARDGSNRSRSWTAAR